MALPLISAPPSVTIQIPAPPVTVQVPAPAPVLPPPPPAVTLSPPVVTMAPVPDYYVWDGYEYVGVVGGQYYYLGPGNVWLVLDPARSARFHGWERDHANWRTHAIHNERYRQDAAGHETRLRDNPGHDKDRDH